MAPRGAEGPAFSDQLILILIIFSIFYFIVFRPMRKKQRAAEEMLSNLKSGDRIVTNGGIHGTVVGVNENSVQLRVADHVKIRIDKSAIGRIVEERSETTK